MQSPEHPRPSHDALCVSRAYDHQSIHVARTDAVLIPSDTPRSRWGTLQGTKCGACQRKGSLPKHEGLPRRGDVSKPCLLHALAQLCRKGTLFEGDSKRSELAVRLGYPGAAMPQRKQHVKYLSSHKIESFCTCPFCGCSRATTFQATQAC